MNYREWSENVPNCIQEDSLWKMHAYRLSLFAAEIGWTDVSFLAKDQRTYSLANQLYRSLGSVGANIAEGYSRGSSRERAHFYEYALGSARESRDWYYKGRHVLEQQVIDHRLQMLTEIIRLLLTMIPQQRHRSINEENAQYLIDTLDVPLSFSGD